LFTVTLGNSGVEVGVIVKVLVMVGVSEMVEVVVTVGVGVKDWVGVQAAAVAAADVADITACSSGEGPQEMIVRNAKRIDARLCFI
jgi:hypothetical protein